MGRDSRPDEVRRAEDAAAVEITSHALLRWLERRHGVAVETLRARVAAFVQAPRVRDDVCVRFIEVALGLPLDGPRDELRVFATTGRMTSEGRQTLVRQGDYAVVIQEDAGRPVMTTVLGPGMRHRLDGDDVQTA